MSAQKALAPPGKAMGPAERITAASATTTCGLIKGTGASLGIHRGKQTKLQHFNGAVQDPRDVNTPRGAKHVSALYISVRGRACERWCRTCWRRAYKEHKRFGLAAHLQLCPMAVASRRHAVLPCVTGLSIAR